MKANDQFILRTIADDHLLIPVGEMATSVKGMIALSESGALIYEKLREGCSREDLLRMLTSEYEVSEEEALGDLEAFLDQLRRLGILVED